MNKAMEHLFFVKPTLPHLMISPVQGTVYKLMFTHTQIKNF